MKKYFKYFMIVFLLFLSFNVKAYSNWAIAGEEFTGFRSHIKGYNYNLQTSTYTANSSTNYDAYMLLCVEPNSFDQIWVQSAFKELVSFDYNQTNVPCSYTGSSYDAGRYFELKIAGEGSYGIWFRPSRDISIEVKKYELFDSFYYDSFKWKFSSFTVDTKKIENNLEEAEKTRKGILKTLIDLPKNIVNFLIDGFKKLFIPNDNYFKDKFTQLNDFFSKKLGILFYPFDLFKDFINLLLEFSAKGDGIIKIPDIREPFSNNILIKATNYNFGGDFKTALGKYYGLYQSSMYTIFFILFINFIRKYWKDIVEVN